jgi:subtilase family serine protease
MGNAAHIARLIGTGALWVLLVPRNSIALEKLHPMDHVSMGQNVEFDVFLPLQHSDELDQLLIAQHTPGSPIFHRWLTPEEFRSRFGSKAENIAETDNILSAYGLKVTRIHSHGMHAEGKAGDVERAFGISLWNTITAAGRRKLIANESPSMPSALSDLGAQIVHFSPVVRFHPNSRRFPSIPQNRYSAVGPYWFDDLKQAYDFPSYLSLTGKGRTIAIMSVSDYLDSDVEKYFSHEGLNAPAIERLPIAGGAPFDPNSGASGEVELDIEQAGGMAPGSNLLVCNLPDATDGSFIDGYLTLVEGNLADIVSTSFSSPEGGYTAAYNGGIDETGIMQVFDDLFRQGNAQGITFVSSSGDAGGLDLPPLEYFTAPPQIPSVVVGSFLPGVEFFASSPHVTAVGGTNLITTYHPITRGTPQNLESKYVSENANGDPEFPIDPYNTGNLVSGGYWASGGGKSIFFAKPTYQLFVHTRSSTRSVPDISFQMGGCPTDISERCGNNESAVFEVFAGNYQSVIGTSVSAPAFAGLLALKEEHLAERLGNANYEIYSLAAEQFDGYSPYEFFHQNIPGFNGYYHTHSGYNFVLGVGTPFGRNFILAPNVPPAGNPQTPSNP